MRSFSKLSRRNAVSEGSGGPLRVSTLLALVAALIGNALWASSAFAVKANSPEVKKLIDKGIKFLEQAPADNRVGAQALVAMTLLKAGKSSDHPLVQKALAACKALEARGNGSFPEEMYSVGLVVMFLCELDPVEYSKEIEYFFAIVRKRQKEHGGWGYTQQATGDTSMTQYGILAAWTAKEAGYPVPDDLVERAANWLIRTQTPAGAWGYQADDPGTYTKIEQSGVRLSLVTAALGSCLITGNLLGFIDMSDEVDESVPPALVPVEEKGAQAGKQNANVESQRLRDAIKFGGAWFRQNYKISPGGHKHYYLYALERYMSFVELAEGRRPEEPSWYNEGYKHLKETQKEDGSWESNDGPVPDTAFAILFLLRSTRKAIEKSKSFGDGTLVGGRGLPKDTSKVRLRGGQLVAANQARAVEDVLKALGDADDEELGDLAEAPIEIKLSERADQRDRQLKDLRQVVRSGSPKARLAAVRTLGVSRELSAVPLLIYALTDPDPQVAIAADQALRISSRRLNATPLKLPLDEAARQAAHQNWTNWYRQLYPDLPLD